MADVSTITTAAHIIVTVDHTGYIGPVTIGAITTPPGPGGAAVNSQNANITRISEEVGYQTTLYLVPNQHYILYAVTEGESQILGGAAYFLMPNEEITVHLTIYGQPMFLPSETMLRAIGVKS